MAIWFKTMSDLHYFRPDWIEPSDKTLTADIVVYGATSAGVIAAVEARRLGKSVVLLQPGKSVGGLTSGGLGWTDYGKKHVIGGVSREFYRRVGKLQGVDEEFLFAPSAAQAVFDAWLNEAGVAPVLGAYLESVEKSDGRLTAVRLRGGLVVRGKVFVDCTYEGDLLAMAGASFTVGREGRDVYGETYAGIQVMKSHQFDPDRVDPYIEPGKPSSGLLPMIELVDLTQQIGQGDHRLQAFNFRICMTDDPALRLAWEKPEGYRAIDYELAVRWFNGPMSERNDMIAHRPSQYPDDRARKVDFLTQKTPGGFSKTDTNNHGPVSSDFIGGNWDWPGASYERREEIFQAHVRWQKGYYWTMANDDRIPSKYRAIYQRFGLARDEFTSTGNWSHSLYVREARRMVSDYVLTENDCMHRVACDDPVGLGSYNLDSHNCTRFVNSRGMVQNEGDVQVAPAGPYRVSYRSIRPRQRECRNLLVPVCISTSHIAYGSVRMEPVFMVLAQSAVLAANIAIDGNLDVQDVPYAALRAELDRAGQVL
jgi:hypothetical protein